MFTRWLFERHVLCEVVRFVASFSSGWCAHHISVPPFTLPCGLGPLAARHNVAGLAFCRRWEFQRTTRVEIPVVLQSSRPESVSARTIVGSKVRGVRGAVGGMTWTVR